VKQIIVEYKEDLWRIPADTGILIVKFQLSMNAAKEIVDRCRELDRLVVNGHNWAVMQKEVKDYLTEQIHIVIEGDVEHNISKITEDEIREKYNMGHKSIEQLSKDYGIHYDDLKHIIEGK